jgi:alanine racemase
MDAKSSAKSWCYVSKSALLSNVHIFKKRLAEGSRLGAVVKSNAYGHGFELSAKTFAAAGADWLIVNDVQEAQELRRLGLHSPVYVCGPLGASDARKVVDTQARVLVTRLDQIQQLAEAGRAAEHQVPIHVKIETGCNRQGSDADTAFELVRTTWETEGVVFEGISTHYADIEDTTDHRFAKAQLEAFNGVVDRLVEAGYKPRIRHTANSAATILWPQTHADLVRVGIAAYGLWPSRETYATALEAHARTQESFIPRLQPALSWYTRVAELKTIPAGSYVGYGRTYRTTHETRLAVLPIGYFEGYDRKLSNVAHVLINGRRAPVRGRVCMNMFMVDVTHIDGVDVGTVVTLVGRDGEEHITVENLASWAGSINYAIVTGIHSSIPRIEDPRG